MPVVCSEGQAVRLLLEIGPEGICYILAENLSAFFPVRDVEAKFKSN